MKALWILGLVTPVCYHFSTYAATPRFTHVVTIVLENSNYSEAVGQPFLTELAAKGARLDNFQAEAHPSQPNYVALTSGSTNGVRSDSTVNLSVNHIGDLLEAHQLTWKVYAEDYPGNCYTGSQKGLYVRKHVPFISYLNVQQNPSRCANIVNADQFETDIQNGTLPNYSFFVPNLDDDGHNTSVSYADTWLSQKFGPLLNDPKFTDGLLLVITFDESEGLSYDNHILTILYGPSVQPGVTSNASLNHYSLLQLAESNWSLGNLGNGDPTANPIDGIWK